MKNAQRLGIIAVLALGLCAPAFADTVIRNETLSQLYGAEGDSGSATAVDRYGRRIAAPASAASTSEVTPIPQITVLPTAIPTAWPTPQFSNSEPLSSLTIRNGFDQNVWCDYGVSTPAPFTVPAGSTYTSNFASRDRRMSSSVRCLRPAATPASGTLEIWGEK